MILSYLCPVTKNHKDMKRIILFLLVLCLCGFSIHANASETEIPLDSGIYDPTTGNENPRGPVLPPSVSINGHTLYTQCVPFDVTLQVLDTDGVVVYSTFVSAYTHSVILPASLSGDYVIQLIEGYWYFYGWIHL